MPGNRCSNCIAYNFECTYNEAAKVMSALIVSMNIREFTPRPEARSAERVREAFYTWIIKLTRGSCRYVESLETRLEKMEGLLQRVCLPPSLHHHRRLFPASYAPMPISLKN